MLKRVCNLGQPFVPKPNNPVRGDADGDRKSMQRETREPGHPHRTQLLQAARERLRGGTEACGHECIYIERTLLFAPDQATDVDTQEKQAALAPTSTKRLHTKLIT